MRAVRLLMEEHRVIERALAVLQTIADRLEQGEAVEADKVTALLDFFRVFADECHHAKEEKALFPQLEAKGVPRAGGPIGVMLHEHEEGRALQQQMRLAFSGLSEMANRRLFRSAARQYIALLRQHICKEDNVLFPMAQHLLTESEDAALVERLERQERDALGEGVHERYHQLVRELEAEFY
jgi:hemerythrin-like domain-containing protein